jgi:hypothetical protein
MMSGRSSVSILGLMTQREAFPGLTQREAFSGLMTQREAFSGRTCLWPLCR